MKEHLAMCVGVGVLGGGVCRHVLDAVGILSIYASTKPQFHHQIATHVLMHARRHGDSEHIRLNQTPVSPSNCDARTHALVHSRVFAPSREDPCARQPPSRAPSGCSASSSDAFLARAVGLSWVVASTSSWLGCRPPWTTLCHTPSALSASTA